MNEFPKAYSKRADQDLDGGKWVAAYINTNGYESSILLSNYDFRKVRVQPIV